VIFKGIARGKMIELDEPLPFEDGQPIIVTVQPRPTTGLRGSPAALLEAVRRPPHVTAEDVDELEQAIREARLPVSEEGIFDERP
jgi:hypothetical protein